MRSVRAAGSLCTVTLVFNRERTKKSTERTSTETTTHGNGFGVRCDRALGGLT